MGDARKTIRTAVYGEESDPDFQPLRSGVVAAVDQVFKDLNFNKIEAAVDVRTAVTTTKHVAIDTAMVIGELDDTRGYFDTLVTGEGSLKGLYRKPVIPNDAPPAIVFFNDVRPSQLPVYNAASAPVAVLLADSVGSNRANSWGATGMLTDVLERELRNQSGSKAVTFYNRAIGGQNFTSLNDLPTGLSTWPEWYTDQTKKWLDYAKDLSPDVVFISMGMNNDSATMGKMAAIRAKVKAWTKVPDIVWLTNLNPSPNSYTPSWYSIADQEVHDQSAGAIRSLARYWGDPLLDMHRQHCVVRDGFDPTISTYERYGTVSKGAGNAFVTTEVMTDFRVTITFTPYASGLIGINLDGMQDGFVFIVGEGSNNYRILIYAGKPGDTPFGGGVEYVNKTFSAPPTGGQVVLEFARAGDFGTLRNMTNVRNFGEFTGPVWSGKIVVYGGRTQAKVIDSTTGNNSVTTVLYDYGRPRLNMPSIRNSKLWGRGIDAIDIDGGSGYNHPGDKVGAYVYEPVLKQASFRA